MFATHPASDERSATLARLAAADTGGFVGAAEYGERLADLQQLMLDDELKRGQHGETLVLLDRMVTRLPQRSELYYYRGETHRLRAGPEDAQRALKDFEQALSLGKEPPQLHRALGYLHRSREQPELARQAFARYVELVPEAADAGLIKSFL